MIITYIERDPVISAVDRMEEQQDLSKTTEAIEHTSIPSNANVDDKIVPNNHDLKETDTSDTPAAEGDPCPGDGEDPSHNSPTASQADEDDRIEGYYYFQDVLEDISKLSVGARNASIRKALKIAVERKKSVLWEKKLRELDACVFDKIADPLATPEEPGYDLWDLKSRLSADDDTTTYLGILFQNDYPNRWRNFEQLGDPDEAVRMVRYGDPSEILIERFGIDMTRDHLSCLDGSKWLNDEVINFFIGMVQERNDYLTGIGTDGVPKCFCFNTFFFNMLSGGDDPKIEYNYRAVARWTARRKVDVFAMDVLLIPVHAFKTHWCLGMVDMRPGSRRILLFDSLGGSNRSFFKNIRRWLQDEHMDKKKEPLSNIDEWLHKPSFDTEHLVPRQQNGYDCGVFLCLYAECLSIAKKFDFSQRDVGDLRIKMIQQILCGSIFR